MTFPVNLMVTCYYFETLLMSRDVNNPMRLYVNKDGRGVNDLPSKPNFNMSLFTNLDLPTLHKAIRRSRDINKDGGVKELPCKPNFDLLLF